MTTALERLERHAGRVGWKLRWKSEPLRVYPNLTSTKLDIIAGRRMVTAHGPIAVIWGGREATEDSARERVARMVLRALPPACDRQEARAA